jgi:Na+-driven multidrug efflux pump
MNIYLIKNIGISGAAIATFFSYSTSVFLIFFIKKTRKDAILMLKSIIILK